MESIDATEYVDLLLHREELLRRIDDAPREKSALVEATGVSRSTVDRGVRELEAAGLVERYDGGYRRTAAGRIAIEAYDDLVETFAGLAESRNAVRDLPPDTPLDPVVVRDASVAVATPPDPGRPTRVQRDLVERATHQRLLAPTALPQHVAMYGRQIGSEDFTGEFLITSDVLELLVENYRDELEDALAGGGVQFRETDSLPPYGLSISETPTGRVAGVLVYTASGVSAFLEADSARAVEWAEELFEDHWSDARPISD